MYTSGSQQNGYMRLKHARLQFRHDRELQDSLAGALWTSSPTRQAILLQDRLACTDAQQRTLAAYDVTLATISCKLPRPLLATGPRPLRRQSAPKHDLKPRLGSIRATEEAPSPLRQRHRSQQTLFWHVRTVTGRNDSTRFASAQCHKQRRRQRPP